MLDLSNLFVKRIAPFSKEKPFDTIAIRELTSKAGVSRTTIHRNSHSPEDVLIDYFREHPFRAFSADSYAPDKIELKSRIRDSLLELKENYSMRKKETPER